MGTATYRIGPSDVFLPGDLRADAATLDGQVQQEVAALASSSSVPTDVADSFSAWVISWNQFRSANFDGFFSSFFSSLNDSNRDQLISFENQYGTWRSQIASYGTTPPGPEIEPSTGSGDTLGAQLGNQLKNLGLPSLSSVTIFLVVGAGIFLLWKFAK